MKIIKFLAAGVISLAAVTGNAATIWQPTDVATDANGNVNILQFSLFGISLNGGSLALFEDTNVNNKLVLGDSGGLFEFADLGDGQFTVNAIVGGIVVGGPITMTGNEFTLGVKWEGGSYVGDSSYVQNPEDLTSFVINFSDGATTGNVIGVDLQPVPLPATAWLFGAALLGFAGVSRRTKA